MDDLLTDRITRVPPDVLRHLISTKRFLPRPCSPFGFLVPSDQPATAPAPLSPENQRALEILAVPDARIGLKSRRGRTDPVQVFLFRRGDRVATGGLEPQGPFIGRPIAVQTLVEYLVTQLSSQPPSGEERNLLIAPRLLAGLGWLWSFGQRSAADRVRAKDLEDRLAQGHIEEPQALLAELVQAGFLEASEGMLGLARDWIPWLSRVWSPEHTEVELCLLPQDRVPGPADLDSTREHVVFVGPRGQRLLAQLVPVDDEGQPCVSDDFKVDVNKADDVHLAYSHLSDDELRTVLASLLTRPVADQPVEKR